VTTDTLSRRNRLWFASLLAGTLLLSPTLACAADVPIQPGASVIGNYLAGRHAEAERDLSVAADFMKAALKEAPDAPDLLRRTFVLLMLEGRIDEAEELARRLIEEKPKSSIANLLLAVIEMKQGRHKKADARLAGLPDSGITGFTAPVLRAWALAGKGDIDEAFGVLDSLDGDKAAQTLHDLHKGLLLGFADRTDEAVAAFDVLSKKESGLSFRMTRLLGNLYERAGQWDKAQALYDQFLQERPDSDLLDLDLARVERRDKPEPEIAEAADGAAEALFGIANSLRQQRARETALVLGRMSLYLRPQFPIMLMLVAEIMQSEDRLVESNAVYERIPKTSGFFDGARLRIANNLHDMERTDEAITMLRELARLRPNDPEPPRTIGDFLRSREQYGEAIAEYDEAIRRTGTLESRHWRLLYTRGIVLEREKQWDKAEQDFLKAIEFEPDQPYVLNYLGYSWIEQGRHLDRAQDMIRKAVKLRPNDGYIIDSLGWVYYRFGKYDDAVAELEKAVEYRPEDPIINDHLGDAYWQVDRRMEARFQWKRSLSLDPEPDLAEKINGKLKRGLIEDEANGAEPASEKTNNSENEG